MEKVISYAKYHTENASAGDDVKAKFDQDFVKVEQGTLFEMILAANYLDIKPFNLTCKTVADMIKGKSERCPQDVQHPHDSPLGRQVRKGTSGARTAKVCWRSHWIVSLTLDVKSF